MLIFHYTPETGVYCGSSEARPDPVEWELARAAVRAPLEQLAHACYAAAIEEAAGDSQAIGKASNDLASALDAAESAAAQVEPPIWMIPASATDLAPPLFGFDEQAVMTADGWIVGPDAQSDLPSLEQPQDRAAVVRATRDTLIYEVRWQLERHRDQVELGGETSLSSSEFVALLTYVQALRDVPQQSGFPDGVEWPALPTLPTT